MSRTETGMDNHAIYFGQASVYLRFERRRRYRRFWRAEDVHFLGKEAVEIEAPVP